MAGPKQRSCADVKAAEDEQTQAESVKAEKVLKLFNFAAYFLKYECLN